MSIGVIGGSGLYDLPGLTAVEEVRLGSPYGEPSGPLMAGTLAGRRVVFLSRHGRGHTLSPAEVPARANIHALKSVGVRQIVSVSAVGSLREELAPGDVVVPDQIVDRTRGTRASTFFGGGVVAHVSFADPFCARLRPLLAEAARSAGARTHDTGTYCCVEGPQFSTRAESDLYRSWGMDVIGMTALPEAKLAREAELCYVGLALVTDYDCWRRDDPGTVSAHAVADVMRRNVDLAREAVVRLVERLPDDFTCPCQEALGDAVMTGPEVAVPGHARWLLRKETRV
ncbi:S-methyl-5'-thioadenosine phosphorylase [Streptosporangium oxazolinicum]|uniref:S-methyl-5'-thioadenosine phosphorylase n=1 Tax=Streptosporangium oxazolinicum TaxID=909287 RepID=A0ABP8ALA4_9ACTN